MKTGMEICGERGLHFDAWPGENVPAEEFEKREISIVVACRHCTSTIAFPSCIVMNNGYIYCEDCADGIEEPKTFNPNPAKFKQDNPYDQMVVVLNSMAGSVLNAEDGLITYQQLIERMNVVLKDLRVLSPYMSSDWNHE